MTCLDVAFAIVRGHSVLDISFQAPIPGVTVLFGPSGAGKSSVVAALGGLLRPATGRLALGGTVFSDTETGAWVAPERRRVGMVFQDARLFPHLSVEGNLRYGLRRAPPGPVRFDRVVDLLGIGGLLRRRPHSLSGGEAQRVAIGRALLSQPRLLLMDEPLASLDAERRAEILPFLAALRRDPGIPIVYVTHAIEELAALADTVVLLAGGRVTAVGPLGSMTGRADLPLAARDDAGVVLPVTVADHDPLRRLTRLAGAGGLILLAPLQAARPGTPLRVRVPANEIILAAAPPGPTSVQNGLHGIVAAITAEPARHAALVEVALPGGAGLLARVTADAVERLGLAPGVPLLALVKSTSLRVLPA